MSEAGEIEKLWQVVAELRQQLPDDEVTPTSEQMQRSLPQKRKTPRLHEGTSSSHPMHKIKRGHFNETHTQNYRGEEARLIELQNKLRYEFKDKEILKRAVRHCQSSSSSWSAEDDGVLIMLGKSIIQTCVYYQCVKKNTFIAKGKLHKRLESFMKRKEYGMEARWLKLSAICMGSENQHQHQHQHQHQLRNIEAKCYTALLGAIAVDTNMNNAIAVFHALRKWND